MSIAVTPRVGVNTRRDEDRLKAENALLLRLPTGGLCLNIGLVRSRDRDRLAVAGLIKCVSSHGARPSLWALTDAGRARVAAIRAREGKS